VGKYLVDLRLTFSFRCYAIWRRWVSSRSGPAGGSQSASDLPPARVIGLIQATVDDIVERENRDVVGNIQVLDEIASKPTPIKTTLSAPTERYPAAAAIQQCGCHVRSGAPGRVRRGRRLLEGPFVSAGVSG
jgi:hypothetical protein